MFWSALAVGLLLALAPGPGGPLAQAPPLLADVAGTGADPPGGVALATNPQVTPAARRPPVRQPPRGFSALEGAQTAWARRGGSYVRVAPNAEAELISQLFYDTALPLLGAVDQAGRPAWYEVELWGVLRGWTRAAEVNVDQEPEPVPAPWEQGGGGGTTTRPSLAGAT